MIQSTQHAECTSVRRYEQFRRLLLVVELLAPLRAGATVEEITQDVSDFMGQPVCCRTIVRDIDALRSFGLVEPSQTMKPSRWRFKGSSIRAAIVRAVAELHSESEVDDEAAA
jgi:predicted DNA-binding transcriptional regulator YafY